MITFDGISKNFQIDFWGKPFLALDNVSFRIDKGSLVGFLGANGAGKTTLMKILMGFISPDKGSILFDPRKMGNTNKEVISKVGYLPERPYFYPHLSGEEFLMYMGKLNNIKSDILKRLIHEWAERLAIDFALRRKIKEYSKGMLQRLGFISTILHNPSVLIMDEPLSGLDPVGRKELKDAIVDLHKDGKTIFFSSHIVSDIEEICSDIVVLEKGKLFYEGKTDRLIANNTRQRYRIIHGNDSEDTKNEEVVSSEQRDEYIRRVIESGDGIYSVNLCKPSLEEIVYRIKKN